MAKKISKQSKRRLMTLGVISFVGIAYFLITFLSYTYRYISLKKEESKLNQELYTLQEEKEHLKNEIVKLNDPNYVARYAKEKYLYSSDGEYVIKMEEDNNSNIEEQKNYNFVPYIGVGGLLFFLFIVILKKIL